MLQFAPDAIDIAPEILSAVSAVPTIRGYKNPPAGVARAGVAQFSGTSTGGAYLVGLSGTTRTFVGTGTLLYELVSGTWTDRSRAGNYSSGSNRWRFAQFGDTELAINKSTVLQSSTTAAFANVANSPKAACMEVVAGFVLLGNTDDTGLGITGGPNADAPHRWWCSQIFNPTGTWAPDVSVQCATGLLVDTQGKIEQLRRLNNDCVAYKASSIIVGRYVGPPAVWQWQTVSKDIGTSAPESVVSVGTAHYFIGDSDIYRFDGVGTQGIGDPIKAWFFGRLNKSFIANIQSLHDRSAKVIYWFYPSGSDGTLYSVLAYHYDTNRWGAFDLTVKDVLETVTGTITYDDMGTYISTYATDSGLSYDAPFWNANSPVLAYLSSTNYLNDLSGVATSMTMTTGWYGDADAIQVVSRVRPRFRMVPSSATCTPATTPVLGGTVTNGTASNMTSDGRFNVLKAARWHRFAFTFTGSTEVEAVTPTMKPVGRE